MYNDRKTVHRYSVLTLSMIQATKESLPVVSGRANVIKDFVPVLAVVARKYLRTDLPEHRDMMFGLEQSHSLDQILDESRSDFVLL